ncbi:MAG TPA: hypothetical protein VG538_13290 [Vicinamibacterales bacterium]|jgi:hypothetical protein|nr:hypothetical protein [Vicinamibacterales bacterium]
MTNRPDAAAPRAFVARDELDALFGAANPNPARIGCPSPDVLAALARRERPMDDPAYAHLADCSPCYQAFRRLQDDVPANFTSAARRAGTTWWVAAAALALVVTGVWWWRSANPANMSNAQTPIVTAARLIVDLRPYAVSRSTDTSATVPPLILPASRLDLTILLPTGAEPGSYDVRLVDGSSRSLAAASGPAEIRDFVTTLTTTLDLRAVPPGAYRLDVRPRGDSWRSFPATVR